MARYATTELVIICPHCDARFTLREASDVAIHAYYMDSSQTGAAECPRCDSWIYDGRINA